MARWSWGSAGGSSAIATPPTTRSRRPSSSWRKARSLWIEDSLGGWLHRVASRIALQMRADAARRRDCERLAAERAAPRCATPSPFDDAEQVIHQEIDRLPDRYREPLVLCCLEGMTYAQAAARLRWSEGRTQGRLARARSLLRRPLGPARRDAGRRGPGLDRLDREGLVGPRVVARVRGPRARHIFLGEGSAVGAVPTAIDALVSRAMRSMIMARVGMVARAGLIVGRAGFRGRRAARPRADLRRRAGHRRETGRG